MIELSADHLQALADNCPPLVLDDKTWHCPVCGTRYAVLSVSEERANAEHRARAHRDAIYAQYGPRFDIIVGEKPITD